MNKLPKTATALATKGEWKMNILFYVQLALLLVGLVCLAVSAFLVSLALGFLVLGAILVGLSVLLQYELNQLERK